MGKSFGTHGGRSGSGGAQRGCGGGDAARTSTLKPKRQNQNNRILDRPHDLPSCNTAKSREPETVLGWDMRERRGGGARGGSAEGNPHGDHSLPPSLVSQYHFLFGHLILEDKQH